MTNNTDWLDEILEQLYDYAVGEEKGLPVEEAKAQILQKISEAIGEDKQPPIAVKGTSEQIRSKGFAEIDQDMTATAFTVTVIENMYKKKLRQKLGLTDK